MASVTMSEEVTSLLLVGRSGHGKSSTGNSILREKVFRVNFNMTEDLKNNGVTGEIREVNGREVQVVDATGLADNDQEFPENTDHFIELADQAIQLAPQTGYSAIVLVLKYGIRFTKQDTVAVQMIKSLFGPEIIQRQGIIVMTCGDQFERDMEDKGVSFQQWCGQQEGEVKQLIEECGQRCVLFDNKTEDPDRQRENTCTQVQQLMDMVELVKSQAGPYTKTNFQNAESERKKLLDMANAQQIGRKLEEIDAKLTRVETKFDSVLDELGKAKPREEDENADCATNLISGLEETKQRVVEQQDYLKQPRVTEPQPDHHETTPEISSVLITRTRTLLLVGRSGHGKSATGNSVLGEKLFQPKFAVTGDSQNGGVVEDRREVNGREVQVVDATGLADNDQEFPENADYFIDLANKVIRLSPQTGYSAIVLVLKYGIRFTKQEVLAVQMIKSLFGPEIIQRHGIIVMTCGDQFERDMEDEGLSFQQWCGQQEGEVKRLMKECGQRCVLFDNKTKDPDRQRQQVQQLMDMADQVEDQAGPYTEINFQTAEPGRKKLRVMAKIPQLKQNLDDVLKDVNQRMSQVKAHPSLRQEFEDLWNKLELNEADIQKEDEGTQSVTDLVAKLDATKERLKMLQKSLGVQSAIQTQPECSGTASMLPTYTGDTEPDSQEGEEGCIDCCRGFWYYLCCCCCCPCCCQDQRNRYEGRIPIDGEKEQERRDDNSDMERERVNRETLG